MSPSVSIRLLLTQSDARLMELARDGHERAFEALVQRYRHPLLNYCRRLLLPNERAEDALQQGLLQAWLALQNGCEVRHAKPWLYQIVHNAALNALRSSSYDYVTLSETLHGADAPESDLDRRIAVREALAGLAALPEMQREALLRTAVDGHSHEQAARALGLTEGALRGLVYRARAALRTATTALTPPQVVNWALSPRTGASLPTIARLGEAGAGGGSLGLGGMLMKGGAVAVTAGALAGGVVAVHRAAHRLSHSARPSIASAAGAALPKSSGSEDEPTTVQLASDRGARQPSRNELMRRASGPVAGRRRPLSRGTLGGRALVRDPMHVSHRDAPASGNGPFAGAAPRRRSISGSSGTTGSGNAGSGGFRSTGKDSSSTEGTKSTAGDGSSSDGSGSGFGSGSGSGDSLSSGSFSSSDGLSSSSSGSSDSSSGSGSSFSSSSGDSSGTLSGSGDSGSATSSTSTNGSSTSGDTSPGGTTSSPIS